MAKTTHTTTTLPPRRPAQPTRMRELRVARGLTQLDLALIVGIAPTYLGTLERGPSRMTPEVADRVARALGCTAEEIRGAP